MKNRERLGSRLGFIMLSAGCAIGCGNVWKFPWMCGQNGGGGFMLVYLACLVLLGLPAIVMEFAIGRASQASPVYVSKARKTRPQMGNLWHCMSDWKYCIDGILYCCYWMDYLLFC